MLGATASALDRPTSAGGIGVSSPPTWAIWWIVVATVLSPVLAFLTAIAVEALIGALMDAGWPAFLAIAVAGVLGWFLFPVRSSRPGWKASAPR